MQKRREDYVTRVFEDGGLLAQAVPGYVMRPQQVELARAVDAAIVGSDKLVAEAPTGTGKSLAYGVPAAHHGGSRGTRTLVVTANIALQEQLVRKDLPLLQQVMPNEFKFALLKGRGNYLCLAALDSLEAGQMPEAARHPQAKVVREWAEQTTTGDVSELPVVPDWRLWSELSSNSDDCPGKHCARFNECWTQRAKRIAAESQVVVANYHLLFSDMMARGATGGERGVLPPFDALVMDEVHKAADICRDFVGGKFSRAAARGIVRNAMKAAGAVLSDRALAAMQQLDAEADEFFRAAGEYRASKLYSVRLRDEHELEIGGLVRALREVAKAYELVADSSELAPAKRQKLRNQVRLALDHAQLVDDADSLRDKGFVYFLEEANGGAAIASKPIHVGETLKANLWSNVGPVVGLSATAAVNRRFDHICNELGLQGAKTVMVDSPFDMARQALLVVPDDMPMPTEREFGGAVAEHVAQAVELAHGRTLALFTSNRVLDLAAQRLRGCKYRVMRQGEAPRTQLLEQFREDVSSVLLGTASFWEGVDAPGEACSCVVIDRLPFPTPDDPVLDAVSEMDPRGWFGSWSLPRAVIAFRQGFGRLIRRASDRGVVVLLDRRVTTKSYGMSFTRNLGGPRLARKMSEVGAFLGGGA